MTRCHFAVRRFALAIVVAWFTLSASDVSGLIIGAVRRRRREPDEDVPALGLRPGVPAGVATQVEEVDVNASFGTKFAFALWAQLMESLPGVFLRLLNGCRVFASWRTARTTGGYPSELGCRQVLDQMQREAPGSPEWFWNTDLPSGKVHVSATAVTATDETQGSFCSLTI